MVGSNNEREVRFNSVHNDFGDKLVGGVSETYSFEVFERYNISIFGNEAEEGDIIGSSHSTEEEYLFAKGNGF